MGCTMALLGALVNAFSLHSQKARDLASTATYEYVVQENFNIYGSGGIFAGNGAPRSSWLSSPLESRLDVRRLAVGRPARTRRRKPATVWMKPILWDIWAQTNWSMGDQGTMWEIVVPLAAVPKSNLVDPATVQESGDREMLRAVLSTVKCHYPALSPPLPLPPASKKERPPHLLIKRTSIQIAVTIAMPTLSTSVPSRYATRERMNANEELVEFCIGTMEIPLRRVKAHARPGTGWRGTA
ncbi:hypothetical protein F5J12DRAFT_496194 [Pisolithus orientalis]|uniref:uncharacterized protein n=1 Tax=Pisolithus orientalis TaxID=936130 RepID=UPI002224D17F|nr:uncharacterized protein F5J12DRAFT_496194 [Pisolithus orientalis]KAI6019957.1 hypothetical protein F5J12DRAFT_496194 [Pisolithus orientalis]